MSTLKDLYSEDLGKVAKAVKDVLYEDQRAKQNLIPLWKKCVAFANGDQISSAVMGKSIESNQAERLQRQNARAFAYQTDEISPCVRAIVSYMTKQRPTVEVFADNTSDKGKSIARVGGKLLDAKYDIDNELEFSRTSAYWATTTGTVFRKDFWVDDYTPIELTDEQGNVYVDYVPTGKNSVAALSPFQFFTDYSHTDFKTLPYLGDFYVADIDWLKSAYNREGEGYTGEIDQITEDSNIGDSLSTFEEIKFSSPYAGGKTTYKAGSGKCLVVELFVRPNQEYPYGLQIVCAGGAIVYRNASQYYLSSEPTMWHPYTMYGFEKYVNRFFHRGAVEQVLTDQIRINELNGAFLENANTIAKPNLIAPKGSIKRGVLNATGANLYEYEINPLNPNAAPTALPGIALPPQFFEERQLLVENIARRLGANFILQGEAPKGVTAAAALQLLFDNSTGQMSDKMNMWQKFHEEGYTKKLRIIHKYNNLPDQDLIKYLRTLSPDSTNQELEAFVGSESLSDGVVVRIESGSMIPKSEALKQESYKSLMASPAFGPLLGDPGPKGDSARRQLLEKIGIEPLATDDSIDFEKSKWENERILNGLSPVFDPDDIHQIHIGCHTRIKKDPKILERPDAAKIIAMIDQHLAQHKEAEQMAQGQGQMPGQMPMPPEMTQDIASRPQGVESQMDQLAA